MAPQRQRNVCRSVALSQRFCEARNGMTLVEVSVSTLLVGFIVVGALRCLSGAIQAGQSTTNSTIAMLLAEDLMEEILQQDYRDPDQSTGFGVETDEDADLRDAWDDVDDYHNWVASPPVDSDGNAVADAAWKRSVTIRHVDRHDLLDEREDTEDTGVNRITVTVLHNHVVMCELVSVQTTAWISMIPEFGEAQTTGQLPPVNEPPTANIASHVPSGIGNVTVVFSGTGSSDPEAAPLEYQWDFGDGTGSDQNTPTHSFVNSTDAAIAYQIKLTVRDIHGAADTAFSTVTVYPN